MYEKKLIKTSDGSHTLYDPELKEHYHSINGAIQESMHVFINKGFHSIEKNPVRILEIGFGTGLNAVLTCAESKKYQRKVYYHAIEKYPLDNELINSLNYKQYLDSEGKDFFREIHKSNWGVRVDISPYFTIIKQKLDFIGFDIQDTYDIIYFDAFAPDKQPEMWSAGNFHNLFCALTKKGVLVTYSAKGIIKRRLDHVGFHVEKLPGPPGKREMLRAEKL
ncbi:MAG: tRNA (5-methylaminomethyl-2-thiouridine)(34)-methyltransferase MnmD [Bacteroidales bacterium]